MRFIEKPPPIALYEQRHRALETKTIQVAGEVNDRATRRALDNQRNAMKAAKLGGLSNAVKMKKGRSTDKRGNPNAYGVIYAADGDESRSAAALEAYSRGASIKPVKGNWLWYQTPVLARTSKVPGDNKRGRLTPERYNRMGQPLGPLQFAQISPGFAKLYVDVADISIRTGRATRPGKGRPRTKVRTKRVTVFFGIRNTIRGKRYDPQRIVAAAHGEIPADIAREMAAAFAGGR